MNEDNWDWEAWVYGFAWGLLSAFGLYAVASGGSQ